MPKSFYLNQHIKYSQCKNKRVIISSCMADVVGFLFEVERVMDLIFNIALKRSPSNSEWEC